MTARWTLPPARLPLGRRAVLAGLAALPGLALAGPATARDLLDIPAFRTPKAVSALLLGVAVAGPRLVAVGDRGVVIHSDDEGGTWRQAAVPVSVTLTAVHFPMPSHGWAVGHDGVILRSADGGTSWVRQFDGNMANALVAADVAGASEAAVEDAAAAAEFGPSRPLLDVWFRNAEEGIVVGSYGQIFRTRDGGSSWASLGPRMDNPDGLHFNAIAATPSGALLIAGEGGRLHRSVDGGDRWEALEIGAATNLYGARALANDTVLVAHGFGGKIFRREADGPWQPVDSPTVRTLIGSALREDELVLVDAAGGCIVSADGGRSFRSLRPGGAAPVTDVALTGSGRLVQVGLGGARVTPLAV
ncbi:WD40/YVTN/BNR-like repeat-containing protein [Azospirillum agricola]|uniref:WD40/YVTN/BNR-like repeat-containing protein n=1 Tax=Azospirillum agricola TaxID=1720247 RepID=UPI000A0EF1A8|nr:YCF48-related protein [Azospirillum agricola]SMH62802.1 Uncharacterized protein SAMN02982994_6625 [Azospirillum lipoferum]